MRAWKEGDRVSSIATQYPGAGRIIRIGFDTIEVRWPDGSWSRERPQDLIFGGRDEDPVTPFGANIPDPTVNQGWGRVLSSFNAESFAAPIDYSKPLNPESQTREEYSKNELVGVINPTMEVLPQPWGSGSLESILTSLSSQPHARQLSPKVEFPIHWLRTSLSMKECMHSQDSPEQPFL